MRMSVWTMRVQMDTGDMEILIEVFTIYVWLRV